MHPMFAELFMSPEEPEADERRRVRRARRTRQLRTVSAARAKPRGSAAFSGRRAP
jgi:hypothetical protein